MYDQIYTQRVSFGMLPKLLLELRMEKILVATFISNIFVRYKCEWNVTMRLIISRRFLHANFMNEICFPDFRQTLKYLFDLSCNFESLILCQPFIGKILM